MLPVFHISSGDDGLSKAGTRRGDRASHAESDLAFT